MRRRKTDQNVPYATQEASYGEFQTLLYEISDLRDANEWFKPPQPCGPDSECLGGLAFEQTALQRYQLLILTLQAGEISKKVEERISAVEWLELANAYYVSGRFDKCIESLVKAEGNSSDYVVRYRGELIRAQVAFSKEEIAEGRSKIKAAIDFVRKTNQDFQFLSVCYVLPL